MMLASWHISVYTLRMPRLEDSIRDAIKGSGQSQYRIAKETGIAQSRLSRLLSGERGLSADAIERIADYLGLEIVIRPKGPKGR